MGEVLTPNPLDYATVYSIGLLQALKLGSVGNKKLRAKNCHKYMYIGGGIKLLWMKRRYDKLMKALAFLIIIGGARWLSPKSTPMIAMAEAWRRVWGDGKFFRRPR